MSEYPVEIVFRESRAKAAVAAVALTMLDICAAVLAHGVWILLPKHAPLGSVWFCVAFGLAIIAIPVGLQLYFLTKIVFPSCLILTTDGGHRTGPFERWSFRWEDYGPARMHVRFSPRGGRSHYILLESKVGGAPLSLFADGYTQDRDALLRCAQNAQLVGGIAVPTSR